MNSKIVFFFMIMCCCSVTLFAQTNTGKKQTSTNPVFDGWYADPEGVVFGDKYWIYPTYSAPFEQQLYMDAFSSPDLVHWRKHPKVLSVENISWLRNALWAPAVIEANGKYYFYFGANNIYHESEVGGIGVAVADRPEGPFKDALGKPLIGKIVNGAQPIDQFVFKDDDGQYYMYYGGWGHCNMVKMGSDLISIVPFEDGTLQSGFRVSLFDILWACWSFPVQRRYYLPRSSGGKRKLPVQGSRFPFVRVCKPDIW